MVDPDELRKNRRIYLKYKICHKIKKQCIIKHSIRSFLDLHGLEVGQHTIQVKRCFNEYSADRSSSEKCYRPSEEFTIEAPQNSQDYENKYKQLDKLTQEKIRHTISLYENIDALPRPDPKDENIKEFNKRIDAVKEADIRELDYLMSDFSFKEVAKSLNEKEAGFNLAEWDGSSTNYISLGLGISAAIGGGAVGYFEFRKADKI